ncbi:hypothetical protein [Mesorhizobium sp. SARCC-RB16n]|uniref:hypothetical protein n=1 Tax=Mesorhizobium sp. SARCC-RB16n TaxID=2116687 RepID=UPI001FEE5EE7|nr:hypothetical protein [Mesorhizobium sp. SARCC-RB16n]
MLRIRNDGIPVVDFTWYSLTDQVDWDSALRENNGQVNAVGLYDRTAMPGRWDALIRRWSQTGTSCSPLKVSVSLCPSFCHPSRMARVFAQQDYARGLLHVDRIAEAGAEPFEPSKEKAKPDAPG